MRSAREILSTCEALANLELDVDRNCLTCKVEEENCLDALIGCSSLSEFWRGTNYAFVNECKEGIDFLEWLYMALTQWNDKQAKMFAIATQRINNSDDDTVDQRDSTISSGINSDRNNTGQCLMAMTKRIEIMASIDYLEAVAILEGMQLAKIMSCNYVVIKSD
ncbi:uncharacterized protein G2W53_026663 [Senna tora]|uniref:RNase H type-1 domain-containing protein n=1 Tax=Senna tora TaxID=362788 RepID=A0A834WHM7_9FABA|nr:uncharacterized protein G2W53_026663 [Senna tora]